MHSEQGFNAASQLVVLAARLQDVALSRFGIIHPACNVEDGSLIAIGRGHDTLRGGM